MMLKLHYITETEKGVQTEWKLDMTFPDNEDVLGACLTQCGEMRAMGWNQVPVCEEAFVVEKGSCRFLREQYMWVPNSGPEKMGQCIKKDDFTKLLTEEAGLSIQNLIALIES